MVFNKQVGYNVGGGKSRKGVVLRKPACEPARRWDRTGAFLGGLAPIIHWTTLAPYRGGCRPWKRPKAGTRLLIRRVPQGGRWKVENLFSPGVVERQWPPLVNVTSPFPLTLSD